MRYLWTCHCCGKQFNELPLSFAAEVPDSWLCLTEAEQERRGEIDSDRCVIDGKEFFIRGCLEIPIISRTEYFSWSVWVSVSRKSFELICHLWDADKRDDQPPIFGWLSNNIQGYPQTFGLKTNLHLRNGGQRPFIKLEPTDHPLAIEQREGITTARIEEIASATLSH